MPLYDAVRAPRPRKRDRKLHILIAIGLILVLAAFIPILWAAHLQRQYRHFISGLGESVQYAKEQGGLFQAVPNYVEIPSKLSGVPCRIIAMSGKWFPTGCHKVGASFGCLAPRLVTGQFDATYHHAVWPSTGNYCRGGAFNSKLLACESVAILPQDMSKERFDWLKSIAGQIIATPGCESNVKEIFDKTWELKQDPTMMIFNQFAEMGNPLWLSLIHISEPTRP